MKIKIKPFILVCLCAVMASCASTVQTQKQNKIAQAIKKEGDVFQTQGNYTAALNKLLEAEKMAPDDPYIQNSLGLAYMGKERDDMGITAFNKALSLKPDYTEALNNLGVAYLRDDKPNIAIKTFNMVLEDITYPTPHYPLANIGWAQLAQNNYPVAQKYFLKALREVPGFIPAIHGLAQLYIRTGQTDRAIKYLDKNIRRSPDTVIFHKDLAQTYETCGRARQAIKAWQVVKQLAPENSNLYHEAEQRLFELQ
ncbi:pilus assembly protein PilF [Desulfobacter hydrogenophilus]|uniref:Pilus assembly protein PilF n=1 Tax=Desulfobacter hydrogenophilus TaxID=2291 RepID=A0A328FG03_9BACT|nr:tetratricopeptide repeat protein [Desulfobacter hydrogenophilus]NDY71696.1 tetratricopeptide repeat protein [Desulfobacter hydrogenophilus]QBH13207.1 tetratricopeptide repeat protein [Desulfobacter hydrogenophilus]RAM02372.1 pilus assembly protein PilF [Desulfobacter hydrogenophilus]